MATTLATASIRHPHALARRVEIRRPLTMRRRRERVEGYIAKGKAEGIRMATREGGVEGLLRFLETKTVLLEDRPRHLGESA
jgi:hypothetical protein